MGFIDFWVLDRRTKGSLKKTKTVKLGKSSKQGGWGGGLPVGREFPTFLTGKTVINGKYPKHPETSRKVIKNVIENVDLLRVPKFTNLLILKASQTFCIHSANHYKLLIKYIDI